MGVEQAIICTRLPVRFPFSIGDCLMEQLFSFHDVRHVVVEGYSSITILFISLSGNKIFPVMSFFSLRFLLRSFCARFVRAGWWRLVPFPRPTYVQSVLWVTLQSSNFYHQLSGHRPPLSLWTYPPTCLYHVFLRIRRRYPGASFYPILGA